MTEIDESDIILEDNGSVPDCISADRPLRIICSANDAGTCQQQLETISTSAVGISGIDNINLTVFPLPTAGVFFISGVTEEGCIKIYTLQGQEVEFSTSFLRNKKLIRVKLQSDTKGKLVMVYSTDEIKYTNLIYVK